MKNVSNGRGAHALGFFLLLFAAGQSLLNAQSGGAIDGTVVDQTGRAVQDASIAVKSEGGAAAGTAKTDGGGHFTVKGLSVGSYTVETTAPGFALNTRLNVPVTAAAPVDLSITLNVDAISQSVTVQESVSLAADDGSDRQYARRTSRRNGDQQRRDPELHGAGRGFRRSHAAGAGRLQPQPKWHRPGAGQVVLPRFPRRRVHA